MTGRFDEIATLEGTAKYKTAREGKIPVVKAEFGKHNKVLITFPYNPDLIKKVRSVPKSRWNPEGRYWEVPYSDNTIPNLHGLFGENLILDPYFYLLPLQKELTIRKYSRKTIKSYLRYNRHLLEFTGKKPGEIDNSHIKDYLSYMVETKGIPSSTLNIIINALRFFYGEIFQRQFIYEVKRPKKDKRLPVVSSKKEVKKILCAPQNIKHKATLVLTILQG